MRYSGGVPCTSPPHRLAQTGSAQSSPLPQQHHSQQSHQSHHEQQQPGPGMAAGSLPRVVRPSHLHQLSVAGRKHRQFNLNEDRVFTFSIKLDPASVFAPEFFASFSATNSASSTALPPHLQPNYQHPHQQQQQSQFFYDSQLLPVRCHCRPFGALHSPISAQGHTGETGATSLASCPDCTRPCCGQSPNCNCRVPGANEAGCNSARLEREGSVNFDSTTNTPLGVHGIYAKDTTPAAGENGECVSNSAFSGCPPAQQTASSTIANVFPASPLRNTESTDALGAHPQSAPRGDAAAAAAAAASAVGSLPATPLRNLQHKVDQVNCSGAALTGTHLNSGSRSNTMAANAASALPISTSHHSLHHTFSNPDLQAGSAKIGEAVAPVIDSRTLAFTASPIVHVTCLIDGHGARPRTSPTPDDIRDSGDGKYRTPGEWFVSLAEDVIPSLVQKVCSLEDNICEQYLCLPEVSQKSQLGYFGRPPPSYDINTPLIPGMQPPVARQRPRNIDEYLHTLEHLLCHIREIINDHMGSMQPRLCHGAGSTLCMAICVMDHLFCVNVGDSCMLMFEEPHSEVMLKWGCRAILEPLCPRIPMGLRSLGAIYVPKAVLDSRFPCSYEDTLVDFPEKVREGQHWCVVQRDYEFVRPNLKAKRPVKTLCSPFSNKNLRMVNTLGNLGHKSVLVPRTTVYKFSLQDMPEFSLVMMTDGIKDMFTVDETATLHSCKTIQNVILGIEELLNISTIRMFGHFNPPVPLNVMSGFDQQLTSVSGNTNSVTAGASGDAFAHGMPAGENRAQHEIVMASAASAEDSQDATRTSTGLGGTVGGAGISPANEGYGSSYNLNNESSETARGRVSSSDTSNSQQNNQRLQQMQQHQAAQDLQNMLLELRQRLLRYAKAYAPMQIIDEASLEAIDALVGIFSEEKFLGRSDIYGTSVDFCFNSCMASAEVLKSCVAIVQLARLRNAIDDVSCIVWRFS